MLPTAYESIRTSTWFGCRRIARVNNVVSPTATVPSPTRIDSGRTAIDLLRVRTTCFMLLYGVVWVSLILIYLSEVRRTPVTG